MSRELNQRAEAAVMAAGPKIRRNDYQTTVKTDFTANRQNRNSIAA